MQAKEFKGLLITDDFGNEQLFDQNGKMLVDLTLHREMDRCLREYLICHSCEGLIEKSIHGFAQILLEGKVDKEYTDKLGDIASKSIKYKTYKALKSVKTDKVALPV